MDCLEYFLHLARRTYRVRIRPVILISLVLLLLFSGSLRDQFPVLRSHSSNHVNTPLPCTRPRIHAYKSSNSCQMVDGGTRSAHAGILLAITRQKNGQSLVDLLGTGQSCYVGPRSKIVEDCEFGAPIASALRIDSAITHPELRKHKHCLDIG
ncbi:hypothetical protein BDW22DRAFT_841363 [Trametopsis cervina]|nr:hypothetical protein BDW22DRAFT_841363 [Trametopsis cervina]